MGHTLYSPEVVDSEVGLESLFLGKTEPLGSIVLLALLGF
jgi:hypothetical protein